MKSNIKFINEIKFLFSSIMRPAIDKDALAQEYISALESFDVKASQECIDNIHSAINKGILVSSGSVEDSIIALFDNRVIDETTALIFEKKAFSLRHFLDDGNSNYIAKLKPVFYSFCKNSYYTGMIVENGKLHSLEICKLMLEKDSYSGNFEEKISEAFKIVSSAYGDNKKAAHKAWSKFLNLAILNADALPEALLEFITSENYKDLFSIMKSHLEQTKKSYLQKGYLFAKQICLKIINEINSEDIPALLMLGKIHEDDSDFNAAHLTYSKASVVSFNGVIALIDSYENEIRSLLNEKYSSSNSDHADINAKIYQINSTLDNLYDEWEIKLYSSLEKADLCGTSSDEINSQIITLKTKHARHEKDRKSYNAAYDILSSIKAAGSEAYRLYTELGMLHQTPGTNHRKNKHYDPDLAISMFKKALDCCKSSAPEKERNRIMKSILMPMANTYYTIRKLEEASSTCRKVLDIDKNERNAIQLMKDIEKISAA